MATALLAGGGTAGHVNPLLVVAQALRDRGVHVEVLGTTEGLESRLVPAAGFPLSTIARTPMPRALNPYLLKFPFRLRRAIRDTRALIARLQPDVVVGFGGYVSTPAYLAARKRVPIVIHEGNAKPGFANKLGARWAAAVATTFPGTPLRHGIHTGLPLRPSVLAVSREAADQAAARKRLGLAPDRPTLVVTGGSLGALSLNRTIVAASPRLLDAGVQILHLTGTGKAVPPVGDGHVVVEYLDGMDDAYAAADLVIGRAGAGMVSELAALGIPGVYVPFPHGNGEQRFNAEPTVAAGGGLLVADADFTADWVRTEIEPLISDQPRLIRMGAAAATTGRPDATEHLIELISKAASW